MMTTVVHPSIIVLLAFGGVFEVWIIGAMVFALLAGKRERGYWERVGDALQCQVR